RPCGAWRRRRNGPNWLPLKTPDRRHRAGRLARRIRASRPASSSDPDRGRPRKLPVDGGTREKHLAGGQRRGRRAEVGDARPAVRAPERQHIALRELFVPDEALIRLQLATQRERLPIESERGGRDVVFGLDRALGEPRRLREVSAVRAEAERASLAGPRKRHATPVASDVHSAAVEERRILSGVVRDVADLVQAELL